MKRTIGLLLSLICVSAFAKNDFHHKIVGGVEASIGEFPFIVSLQTAAGRHYCGGSLIKKNWVLTAAHCARGATVGRIVIGMHDQKDTKNAEIMKVVKTIVHPSFNGSNLDFDYALMQLEKDSAYQPIEINAQDIKIPDQGEDMVSTTAGWGTTSEGSYTLPNLLQKVDVPLVSQTACDQSYPGQITDQMICAGLKQGGKDSCQGDSGGPLLVTDNNNVQVLIGVVSWGQGCARPDYYGVYSKVSAGYSWIEANAK